jgi:uncharacterized protein (TIGR00369 family)
MTGDSDSYIERLARNFPARIKLTAALGIEVLELNSGRGLARMPLREELLGDPEHGLIHTGVILALIDSIAGITTLARIGKLGGIATLDLRVDYLHAVRLSAGPELRCRAHCHRLASQIAFTRSEVWQADEAEPIATSQATFMVEPYAESRRSFAP